MDKMNKLGERMRRRILVTTAGGLALALVAGACGGGGGSKSSAPVTMRLGYFPNVTHAVALVGISKGIFQKDLGTDKLDTSKTFNAGPAATEALLSGAIDATFIGPSPSITAFSKSKGAVRIVSGAASGGAGLVVKQSIASVDQLKGKTIATPQLGNTQDVALRAFLKTKGLKTDPQGGGDVSIKPQDNSQTIDTFKQGTIDGAWVPEPFLSRLVLEGGGKLLVDESTLWPQGQWVTTNLLVSKSFLDKHPDTVKRLLTGVVDTVDFITKNQSDAEAATNDQLGVLTSKKLSDKVLGSAFSNLHFTVDPLADTLRKQAKDASDVGLLTDTKTDGIYDLKLLNQVLKDRTQKEVSK
jgi:NitT/TauT family transport system substrate-binding protein